MKPWKVNLQHPIYGDFHIHTTYTDGADTINSYCQRAKINKLTQIAFSEHVRKELSYNFNEYLSEIIAARNNYPDLTILAGCETKVIDSKGNLDIQESIVNSCDFVTAVFHSYICSDKEKYLETLGAMLANPYVDIWGHPTLFAKKHCFSLNEDEILDIIEICVHSKILIEINIKYNLPDLEFLKIACKKGANFVIGSDAHSINELLDKTKLEKIWDCLERLS
jgi:DNA polymerase (family 10)/putative hydrolase